MEDTFVDASPPISLGADLVKTIGAESVSGFKSKVNVSECLAVYTSAVRCFSLASAIRGRDMGQQVAIRPLVMCVSTIQRRHAQETKLSATTRRLWAKDVYVHRDLFL